MSRQIVSAPAVSMRRKIVLAFGGALAVPYTAFAQKPPKIPRITYVSGRAEPTAANPDPNAEALRQGLREFGYVDGKNIVLEYRYLAGSPDRARAVLHELMNVDVIVTPQSVTLHESKRTPKAPPTVMITLEDPVASGLVTSLARPGGNVTGVTRLTNELSSKKLDVLKELLPGLARVGVAGTPATEAATQARLFLEDAARASKLELIWIDLSGDLAYEPAFQSAANQRAQALIVRRSPGSLRFQKQLGELTIKHRLPTMCEGAEEVSAGGLISYATSDSDAFRRSASYVDRILKGARPGDLPIEQPSKFEIAVNMKTAQAIGVKVPQSIYLRADKIFE